MSASEKDSGIDEPFLRELGFSPDGDTPGEFGLYIFDVQQEVVDIDEENNLQLVFSCNDQELFIEAYDSHCKSVCITQLPTPTSRAAFVTLLKGLGAYREKLADFVQKELNRYAPELMEDVSPGGIILPQMPGPEPTQEPQEDKPKRWCFTVGFSPFEIHSRQAKDALEVLYGIGLGRCGLNQELWEKRKRIWKLLDQLSQEMVGEVPSIEELC